MGAKRKSYTPKYRQDAAHLVIDTGRTVAAVSREIGVGEQLLGRWVAIERSRMDDPPEAIDVNERAELERLRRENAELRMDREFLKEIFCPPNRREGVMALPEADLHRIRLWARERCLSTCGTS
ncbi:transposase [Nostocoides sp. Soil756]|jgi:transposase|uniref:transposase n=1 Tax=Nostocoides sp. Soil756 TaxID=1736399 RepID=UPI0025703E15|nr:transposase [Tetrasphaera sp. Soil756]